MSFSIVVAATEKMGIGSRGRLPWKLSKDLKYFKTLTTKVSDIKKQNAVIMGRVTWESLPRALPNRLNVVLTRNEKYKTPEGVRKYVSLDDALKALMKESTVEQIFVIGGAQIYQEAMYDIRCSAIYLTLIFQEFSHIDVYFSRISNDTFRLIERSNMQEENGILFQHLMYIKI